MPEKVTIARLFRDRDAKARRERQRKAHDAHQEAVERQARNRMERFARMPRVHPDQLDNDDGR